MRRTTLAFLALLVASRAIAPSAAPQQQPAIPHADLLDEVWHIVNDNFHDPKFNGVDWPAARERCGERLRGMVSKTDIARQINVMLDELRTSHTHLYRPGEIAYYELLDIYRDALGEELKQYFPDSVVKYEGIGITLRDGERGQQVVSDVLEASPADAAGIHVGDQIIGVEPLNVIVQERDPIAPSSVRISGAFEGLAGTQRLLVLRRNITAFSARPPPTTLRVAVTPQWIVPHEMFLESMRQSARVIERDGRRLAYVRIRSYASENYQELLIDLLSKEPLHSCDGLILDVRGGWGGANPDYLNIFNRDIPALQITTRDGQSVIDRQWRKPVVLLVDEGTRSGKEVLAHAFKTRGIGKVVGARTAGAVMGGQAFLLSDGSLLVVAVTDVHIDGERLEGVGVEPDVVVERNIERLGSADPQVDKAAEVLAQEVKN